MHDCFSQLTKIKRYSIIASLFFGLLFCHTAHSQKLVQDSLVLQLNTSDFENFSFPFSIDTVLDLRSASKPRLLGIDETEVYGLVPIDLFILTPQPLTAIIHETFPKDTDMSPSHFSLGIKNFELSNRPFLIVLKRHQINARILFLHKSYGDSLIPQRELIYESGVTHFFLKGKLKTGYEQAFQKWLYALADDLSVVAEHSRDSQHELPYNYRLYSSKTPWMQLRVDSDVIILPDGFLLDGQLHFVYPEHNRMLFYSPRIIRLRSQNTFDAIEFGLLRTTLQYRLTNKYCLEFCANLLLGFNKWKDVETTQHKIYDALIGDLSMSQCFSFFPKDTKTVLFGVGFHQDLYYIYSQKIKFNAGLMLQIGMQL